MAFSLGIIITGALSIYIDLSIWIIFLFIISIIVFIIIYKKGLLGVDIPAELDDNEKKVRMNYYEMISWSKFVPKNKRWQVKIIAWITIAWIILSIYINSLSHLGNNFSSSVTKIIDILVIVSWIGILGLTVASMVFPGLDEKDPKDLLVRKNKSGSAIGPCLFFILFILNIFFKWYSIESTLLVLLIIQSLMYVSNLEGRFFIMFAINQWFKIRNWDFIRGTSLRKSSDSDNKVIRSAKFVKGLFGQLKALVAFILIPISLITTILQIFTFLFGTIGGQENFLSSLISGFFSAGASEVILLILVFGPFLTLITKPFEFVSIYLNQGLYDKLSSSWDIKTVYKNNARYGSLFRFPKKENLTYQILKATTLIFVYLGWTLLSSLTTLSDSALVINNYKGTETLILGRGTIIEALEICTLIFSLNFLKILISTSRSLIEEKTTIIFARAGKKYKRDLINESLYGEHSVLIQEESESTIGLYLENQPQNWGYPLYLQGIRPSNDKSQENTEKKIILLEKALSDDYVLIPGVSSAAWGALGLNLSRTGNIEETEQAYKNAISINSKNLFAHHNYGIFLDIEGRYDEAEAVYGKAIRLDNKDAKLLNLIGLHYKATNDNKNAVLFLLSAGGCYIEQDPLEIEFKLRPELRKTIDHSGRLEEALKVFNIALELEKNNVDIHCALGDVYLRLNDIEQAEQAFMNALKLNEKHIEAWIFLGDTFLHAGEWQKAEKQYKIALEIDPNNIKILNRMGNVNSKMGKLDEAMFHLNKALKLDKRKTSTWYNMARLYAIQEKVYDARNWLAKLDKKEPNYIIRAKYDKSFDKIRDHKAFYNISPILKKSKNK
jgi:tetratricopeptide (TPR) repeat protein